MRETGYKSGKPFVVELLQVDGVWLSAPAAWAYYRMALAAYEDGVRLVPGLGFRTMAYQTELFNLTPEQRKLRGVGDKVARPGYSNHQSGIAIDFKTKANPKIFPWLQANAARFGWKNTVPSEPWHWEWLG